MSRLKKIFKEDYEKVIKELKKDSEAKLILNMILDDMSLSIFSPQLDDPNWCVKRAYKDGQHSILDELKTLLTQEK